MRQVLRYLLSHYKSYHGWRRAVERYSHLPARLRLYDIQQDGRILSQADKVSIGSNRERIYGQVLSQQVPFARDTVRMAGAGRYVCAGGKLTAEVIFPEDLVRACAARSSRGHDLQIKQQRQPVNVTFQELLDSTEWEKYGTESGNPKCANCMVHSGYEASSVDHTFGSLRGFFATVKATFFNRYKDPAALRLLDEEARPVHSYNPLVQISNEVAEETRV